MSDTTISTPDMNPEGVDSFPLGDDPEISQEPVDLGDRNAE